MMEDDTFSARFLHEGDGDNMTDTTLINAERDGTAEPAVSPGAKLRPLKMHMWTRGILLLSCVGLCSAQMSLNQKLLDFQQLTGLYDKQYGLYEWKRDAIHFDLLNSKYYG